MIRRNMESRKDVPQGFPIDGTSKDKLAWLRVLALEILDFCRKPFPKAHVEVAKRVLKDPLLARTLEGDEEDQVSFCSCATGNVPLYIHLHLYFKLVNKFIMSICIVFKYT